MEEEKVDIVWYLLKVKIQQHLTDNIQMNEWQVFVAVVVVA